jgi:exodeoxyribonuclease VII large subunit
VQPKSVYSLYNLSKSIANLINEHASQSYWVKAEVLKLNYYHHSGHCYPDLVEKQNNKIKTQFRGIIWKTNYQTISKKFEKIGEQLKDDMTIVAEVKVNYHPVHGLSLNIIDIDANYTIGELARQKQETIKRLEEEQLLKLNKSTQLALVPKTIAIISVETSKGYSDFIEIIENNPYNFKFHHKLFPAVLQGDKASKTIISQLKVIQKHQQVFDVVCIIRGGGREIGLSAFDDYNLAKTITQFPIPVLTGIGHSTNTTVSEMVSYTNFITPTKLGEFLIDKFVIVANSLEQNQKNLTYISKTQINTQKETLNSTGKLFHARIINVFNTHKNNMKEVTESLKYTITNRIKTENQNVLQTRLNLIKSTKLSISNNTNQLKFIEQKLNILDPINTLKRGFSITKVNGKPVMNTSQIKKGDHINTRIYKGEIESEILKVKPKN